MIRNKKKFKKSIYISLIIIFIVCLVFFSYKIILNIKDKNSIKNQEKDLNKIIDIVEIENGENINPPSDKEDMYWKFLKYSMIDVNIEDLKNVNKDVNGWLYVNNTNVNYPIVQSSDNDYYLNHQLDKKYNSAGWIFMDYRNNSIMNNNKNTIIYGHGLYNNALFGSLKNTIKDKWFKNNKNLVIKSVDNSYSYLWQIFSIYTIPTTSDYIITDFNNDDEYVNFLDLISNRSIYNFNVNLNKDDKIITLSTCYNSSTKLVIHAKLIKLANR